MAGRKSGIKKEVESYRGVKQLWLGNRTATALKSNYFNILFSCYAFCKVCTHFEVHWKTKAKARLTDAAPRLHLT